MRQNASKKRQNNGLIATSALWQKTKTTGRKPERRGAVRWQLAVAISRSGVGSRWQGKKANGVIDRLILEGACSRRQRHGKRGRCEMPNCAHRALLASRQIVMAFFDGKLPLAYGDNERRGYWAICSVEKPLCFQSTGGLKIFTSFLVNSATSFSLQWSSESPVHFVLKEKAASCEFFFQSQRQPSGTAPSPHFPQWWEKVPVHY